MDLISVIMPTHNSANWVTYTIDNLAAQTYPHFELIVADDGSRDDTVSVVRNKLARGFKKPWQIVELRNNRGPSAARNLALEGGEGTLGQDLRWGHFIRPAEFEIQAGQCAAVAGGLGWVYSPW